MNVISTGVFSKNTNIVVAALKFFLTVAADDEEDRIAEQKEKVFLIFLSQQLVSLSLSNLHLLICSTRQR